MGGGEEGGNGGRKLFIVVSPPGHKTLMQISKLRVTELSTLVGGKSGWVGSCFFFFWGGRGLCEGKSVKVYVVGGGGDLCRSNSVV